LKNAIVFLYQKDQNVFYCPLKEIPENVVVAKEFIEIIIVQVKLLF